MSDWKNIPVERLHYYTGRPLTACDLEDEQSYHLERGRWRNQLCLGTGVVHGFRVTPHHLPACAAEGWIMVHPGLAIDAAGRELILQECRPVQAKLVERTEYRHFLRMCYAERPSNCLPGTPASPCASATSKPAEQYARIREDIELSVVEIKDEEVWRYGWSEPGGSGHCQTIEQACLLIAELKVNPPGNQPGILTAGRPLIPDHHACHTRIVRTNWTHGGAMSIDQLRQEGLRVHFSHPLPATERAEHSPPPPTGVSEASFVAAYTNDCQARSPVIYPSKRPPATVDGCIAHYEVCEGHAQYLLHRTVYVELHCDFILDEHGQPVDGHHLRGLGATDGRRAGGTFRSWFQVTPAAPALSQTGQIAI